MLLQSDPTTANTRRSLMCPIAARSQQTSVWALMAHDGSYRAPAAAV